MFRLGRRSTLFWCNCAFVFAYDAMPKVDHEISFSPLLIIIY